MNRSKLFWLNLRDFIRGLVVAILNSIGTLLANEIQGDYHNLPKKVLIASLIGLGSYLILKLGTNSKGEILKKEK